MYKNGKGKSELKARADRKDATVVKLGVVAEEYGVLDRRCSWDDLCDEGPLVLSGADYHNSGSVELGSSNQGQVVTPGAVLGHVAAVLFPRHSMDEITQP